MKRVERNLIQLFLRNGCMHFLNEQRQEKEEHEKYKKGYEIRWGAYGEKEVAEIIALLANVGFVPGKPFQKNKRAILPVYGERAVERFQELLANLHNMFLNWGLS